MIDFWATWCGPCVAAMPVIKQVTDQFADNDVVLIALNSGEDKEKISQFLKTQEIDIDPFLDPDGKIGQSFQVNSIPQTIVVGKTGEVESVHIGFTGEDALRQRLTDELEVLSIGGRIGSISAAESAAQPSATEEHSDESK